MKKLIFTAALPYYLLSFLLHAIALLCLWLAASQQPTFWGLGLLAYTLGLRHAFDADHIAAIDNTVRKLVNQRQPATGVGFYFSLGHSTVVCLLILVVSISMPLVKQHLPILESLGGRIGGLVSGSFLLILAFANLLIFINLYRTTRQSATTTDELLQQRGFLTRILAPLLRLINHSWQMYPIGFLFGLGFDTATEIALIALSAGHAQTAVGWGVAAFPLLFAAGMNLMDTTDSVMMTGAYQWAFATPERKRHYNLTVTAISVIAAFMIGNIELLQVGVSLMKNASGMWLWLGNLEFGQVGYYLVALLLIVWAAAYLGWHRKTHKLAE